MAYGYCDAPGCTCETYMGWHPLTERRGYQVYWTYALRHRDLQDGFDFV